MSICLAIIPMMHELNILYSLRLYQYPARNKRIKTFYTLYLCHVIDIKYIYTYRGNTIIRRNDFISINNINKIICFPK